MQISMDRRGLDMGGVAKLQAMRVLEVLSMFQFRRAWLVYKPLERRPVGHRNLGKTPLRRLLWKLI